MALSPPLFASFPIAARLVCRSWQQDHDSRLASSHAELVIIFKKILWGQRALLSFETCYRSIYFTCVASKDGMKNVMLTLKCVINDVAINPNRISIEDCARTLEDVCSYISFSTRGRPVRRMINVRRFASRELFSRHVTT